MSALEDKWFPENMVSTTIIIMREADAVKWSDLQRHDVKHMEASQLVVQTNTHRAYSGSFTVCLSLR